MNAESNNSTPDIVCYYDINTKIDQVISANDDISQITRTVKLYEDYELTKLVGTFVAENIHCFVNKVCQMNNSFSFYDIPGGFFSSNISAIHDITVTTLSPSQETVFDIYSGTGAFLHARGTLVIITDESPIRVVKIYFTPHNTYTFDKLKSNKDIITKKHMNITKKRLDKIISSSNAQTKKGRRRNLKVLKHSNTSRNKKQFNLRNLTLKQMV